MPLPRPLVLASTSVYRQQLLARLNLPFSIAKPHVDESARDGEIAVVTAERLSREKAAAVATDFPDALIIGSDQVAVMGSEVFGKPMERQRAIQQLQRMRGRTVLFHTGVCLLDSRTGNSDTRVVSTEIAFRPLTDAEIERYVDAEQPFDCAGSAKSEGYGIALLEYIRSNDPTALIGLPLITLCQMLRSAGVPLP
ncbi:MAG: septum formation inhibitor Maf [Betaproteobacteria bacterium]|nr:septum formation inhibitor Maf [Betaproteobacteria bacterium]